MINFKEVKTLIAVNNFTGIIEKCETVTFELKLRTILWQILCPYFIENS